MFEIGLAVPQVTELCHILKTHGVELPDGIITEDEAAVAIFGIGKGRVQ